MATVFRVAIEFIDRDGAYYPFGAEYSSKDKARAEYLAELGYIEPWVNTNESGQA